ncbi:MAG TPA: MerR family transcriptional regulator, partial [Burkholderiales bacterium]|nr:MerR family transcriptional regulator [Burkholderiales bacterium]
MRYVALRYRLHPRLSTVCLGHMNTLGGDLSISALERELGIGKDTLRIWERRYGFPRPKRDANGERRYPADQVVRLRLVRRLLDQGMRPHQILPLPVEELQAIAAPSEPGAAEAAIHPELLELVKSRDAPAFQHTLRAHLLRQGLERFVLDTVVPLVHAIGQGWASGEVEVFEEHLATEQLYRVLREAVSQVPAGDTRPRVLITTLPGEPHGLGLLLAEAVMRLEGASCMPLGAQTPQSQILAAARAGDSDVVALSFSEYFGLMPMREAIGQL